MLVLTHGGRGHGCSGGPNSQLGGGGGQWKQVLVSQTQGSNAHGHSGLFLLFQNSKTDTMSAI